METGFEKYIGLRGVIARKSANNGVFVIEAKILSVSATHLFVFTKDHEEAIALSEIVRVQIEPGQQSAAGAAAKPGAV